MRGVVLAYVSSLFCGRCSLSCTYGVQSAKRKKARVAVHSLLAALHAQEIMLEMTSVFGACSSGRGHRANKVPLPGNALHPYVVSSMRLIS